MLGVRMGNWKMVVNRGEVHLYDLANDLHEDHDVAAAHPEVVKKMKAFIKQDHTDSPLFRVTLPQ